MATGNVEMFNIPIIRDKSFNLSLWSSEQKRAAMSGEKVFHNSFCINPIIPYIYDETMIR